MYDELTNLDDYDLLEIWKDAPAAVESPCDRAKLLHSYAISPEGYGSLDCAGIYQEEPDEYYAFSAWADTTGWGCRDGVTWYGPFSSVIGAAGALSQEERRYLGFEHSAVPEDIYRDYTA